MTAVTLYWLIMAALLVKLVEHLKFGPPPSADLRDSFQAEPTLAWTVCGLLLLLWPVALIAEASMALHRVLSDEDRS